NTLRLPTLVSYVDPANTRAASLARRLGAVIESQTDTCLTFRHTRPEATACPVTK
ncbi:MAG: hypothetical protein JKX69_13045, partial [Rhodobacteraceae bacterium]|nr:hypothetical protein [Paracoccaceae bacterium]